MFLDLVSLNTTGMDHNLYLTSCGKQLTKNQEKSCWPGFFTMCTLREVTSARFLKLLYYLLKTNLSEDYFYFLVKMVEKLDKSNANMQAV